eukprot:2163602-Rhodomonas_salina.1
MAICDGFCGRRSRQQQCEGWKKRSASGTERRNLRAARGASEAQSPNSKGRFGDAVSEFQGALRRRYLRTERRITEMESIGPESLYLIPAENPRQVPSYGSKYRQGGSKLESTYSAQSNTGTHVPGTMCTGRLVEVIGRRASSRLMRLSRTNAARSGAKAARRVANTARSAANADPKVTDAARSVANAERGVANAVWRGAKAARRAAKAARS